MNNFDNMQWLVSGIPQNEVLDEMIKLMFEGFSPELLRDNFKELIVPLHAMLH